MSFLSDNLVGKMIHLNPNNSTLQIGRDIFIYRGKMRISHTMRDVTTFRHEVRTHYHMELINALAIAVDYVHDVVIEVDESRFIRDVYCLTVHGQSSTKDVMYGVNASKIEFITDSNILFSIKPKEDYLTQDELEFLLEMSECKKIQLK